MENCRNGVFASGYKLRAQKYQRAGDDSGANAVCLTCDDTDVCSKMANEGDWSYPSYECPKGSFLTGWRQNVQDPRGLGLLRDDVALCNVEYKCRSFETWEEVAADMKGQGMEKGTWSRFKECPRGEFICGINTRVEDPNTDDTALNDIRHLCCKPVNARKKKSKKRWVIFVAFFLSFQYPGLTYYTSMKRNQVCVRFGEGRRKIKELLFVYDTFERPAIQCNRDN